MRNLRSEKGAMTILVVVSILFMISFLISSYVISANKVQAQKEIIEQTRNVYSNYNLDEIYNSYFGKNIIPIYTAEQLLNIGNSAVDKIISINGEFYKFPANKETTESENDNNTIYLLMNDIEFNPQDYASNYTEVFDENLKWIPIGNNNKITGNFEGNGHAIKIINSEGTVEHTYSNKNEYGGNCKLSINIIPEDANLSLTVNGKNVEFKNPIIVPYNSEIVYIATKEGYIDKTDTLIVKENANLDIDLEEKTGGKVEKGSITVNFTRTPYVSNKINNADLFLENSYQMYNKTTGAGTLILAGLNLEKLRGLTGLKFTGITITIKGGRYSSSASLAKYNKITYEMLESFKSESDYVAIGNAVEVCSGSIESTEYTFTQDDMPELLTWMNNNTETVINGYTENTFLMKVDMVYAQVRYINITLDYEHEG